MLKTVHREISRLNPEDSFLYEERFKDDFDFPIHFHPEYELNFIYNAKHARRIIGDSIEVIDDLELILVGPNLTHGWELYKCSNKNIYEVTIHIPQGILSDRVLSSKAFKAIKDMFNRSKHGIQFSRNTIVDIMPKLKLLSKLSGIQYYLEFLSILDHLAKSKNQRMLSNISEEQSAFGQNDNIQDVYNYIQENFDKKITLDEISKLVHMSPVSFNRFIKNHTGKTFVGYLNHIRISFASRWLLETDLSVEEISYKCGFGNKSNFNKFFKKIKKCTPKEFRNDFFTVKRVL
ncbi:AraC family transcriptional regulator [Mariniflexile ostreae]|uniref:AraC family transcriptional regulator n=1 Tax=Mariniflexile ostreae TaxID=1520892 RepID=A0ABV5FEF3_9FLAO